ncbi:transcriptional regulator, CarD family [Caloramator fervidus]|uniref:Transcriptional regulator, CarD family n=1 Tax=Caloramator fervidus TaxID=29344 RepID=A0A1H5VHP8_9CLOT|nr:CarD family transcriptional regulator [Caloramator fervidus]SEF86849.1 transcriptional regulator, CarD family [Caloramator fervidus]
MFEINEKVFVKRFGAGVIKNIQEKEFNGIIKKYYEINLIISGICICVPFDEENKIRRIIDKKEVQKVFDVLSKTYEKMPYKCIERYKLYKYVLEKGDILEIAKLIKRFYLTYKHKKISKLDKNSFDELLNLLCSEISLALCEDYSDVKKKIYEILNI